jgi:hypothetical protein
MQSPIKSIIIVTESIYTIVIIHDPVVGVDVHMSLWCCVPVAVVVCMWSAVSRSHRRERSSAIIITTRLVMR